MFDLVALWLFGLFGILSGTLLWSMDKEGGWLVHAVSIAAAAGGLSFWALALFNCLMRGGRGSSAHAAQEGFWFYSGGAVHLEPVVEILKDFNARAQARSALLLVADETGWSFRAGYQCSPALGKAVAHALRTNRHTKEQAVATIEVLDSSVLAFCTPFALADGQEFALISLFEGDSRLNARSLPEVARRCAAWLQTILGQISSPLISASAFQPSPAGFAASNPILPVCCSVCDQLRASGPQDQERWLHWSQWLHECHGQPLTHTICPSCADWLYEAGRVSAVATATPSWGRRVG